MRGKRCMSAFYEGIVNKYNILNTIVAIVFIKGSFSFNSFNKKTNRSSLFVAVSVVLLNLSKELLNLTFFVFLCYFHFIVNNLDCFP